MALIDLLDTNLQFVQNAVAAKCGKVKRDETKYACISTSLPQALLFHELKLRQKIPGSWVPGLEGRYWVTDGHVPFALQTPWIWGVMRLERGQHSPRARSRARASCPVGRAALTGI